jgi:formylglycine-generating enzyme required for sulfatase activity
MSDDEFETLLATWYPPGRQTQPVYWHDDAFNHLAQPVVGVCWFEARAYCAWLSAQTGETFRLPTEAEWEAAARGVHCRRYAFGDDFDAARCNIFETHIRRTTPIGVFHGGGTPEGLMDMTGNTWDWTSSLYTPYPYDAADGREAPSPPGGRRVVRGGAWSRGKVGARASFRGGDAPDYRSDLLGLRVVRSSPSLA